MFIKYFKDKKKGKQMYIDILVREAFVDYKDPIEDFRCPSCGHYACIEENCNEKV
jgi:hypothetical protein